MPAAQTRAPLACLHAGKYSANKYLSLARYIIAASQRTQLALHAETQSTWVQARAQPCAGRTAAAAEDAAAQPEPLVPGAFSRPVATAALMTLP